MKTPFCLDAQIRRREQLNELTEQLKSAVPEEAQGSCHWVYSSVPEALTMVQCTDDKTIKEWHNESFQVRQAELGICPRTTVTSDVSTFGHVHDHISLTTEERVKAYRSELVMRVLFCFVLFCFVWLATLGMPVVAPGTAAGPFRRVVEAPFWVPSSPVVERGALSTEVPPPP